MHNNANFHLVSIWSHNGDSPEEIKRLQEIAVVLAGSFHVPVDEALVSKDFTTIVSTIRRLRGKIGVSELAAMILLALIVEYQMYRQIGIKSDAEFFRRESEAMGISSSLARDYCKRGMAFLKYRKDFLEGLDGTSGIALDDFVKSHMSKLTLYERAVEKFGRAEALIRLKQLNFRDFQKELSVKKPAGQRPQKQLAENTHSSVSDHDEQKATILELNLAPNEKRALHIIAKGSKYHSTSGLTEEQVIEVEKRLRQKRAEIFESNLRIAPIGFQRKAYNPDDPLAISEDLYGLRNINDIILRIRSGLSLTMPARRTIAILLHRLYTEKGTFGFYWKRPYEGVEYTSFGDFAMQELGMGEDYRDYIAVGRVLKEYYYFLDCLSDMDTEAVFLKLRYLPKALNTHKGDEPLVLARLRSLTVREFKAFSEKPDFETTFSKKLTEKQLTKFYELLNCTRNPHHPFHHDTDFIEMYHDSEEGWIYAIERNVLSESKKKNSELPNPTPEAANEDTLIAKKTSEPPLVA
jgi:hypothetical protein